MLHGGKPASDRMIIHVSSQALAAWNRLYVIPLLYGDMTQVGTDEDQEIYISQFCIPRNFISVHEKRSFHFNKPKWHAILASVLTVSAIRVPSAPHL
jgi:hypothetical protein